VAAQAMQSMLFGLPRSMLEPASSPVQYSSPLSTQPPCCRPNGRRVSNPKARGDPNEPAPIYGILDHRRIVHCQEMWACGQSIVGHRRTSYREWPIQIRGLAVIAQTSVQNGTDTRLRRFYHDVQGKTEKSFLLRLGGENGNHKGT